MKSVLITGCSEGGIGFALAQEFHKNGFMVFASARNTSKMAGLQELPNIRLLQMDVTSLSDINTAVKEVQSSTGGTLDVLVNNSGQQHVVPTLEMDREAARGLFDVNFWAVFDLIKAFAPSLATAKGTIVNVSSISGYLHTPFMSVYNASKAALTMFGETLRLEMLPLNIGVLTVITGAVDTRIMKNGKALDLDISLPYSKASREISKMATGDDGIKRMPTSAYARSVVQDVLQGKSGKAWRGASASATQIVSAIAPTSITDAILSKSSGLGAVMQKATD